MSLSISEELLTYVLDYYPEWGGSPEQFLEFILITMSLSRIMGKIDGSTNLGLTGTEEDLASVFIAVFNVDLYPYKDFGELKDKVKLNIDIGNVLDYMRAQSKEYDEYYKLLDEEQIQPSQETVEDEVFADLRTQSIIERLRPAIHFT